MLNFTQEWSDIAADMAAGVNGILQVFVAQYDGALLDAGNYQVLYLKSLPPSETGSCRLTFALVTRGPEEHILPSAVLDDWGRERRGREMYTWIYENGDSFPRAELFGLNPDGSETQCFVRHLEIEAPYPCYAFLAPDIDTVSVVQIAAIVLQNESVDASTRIHAPESADDLLKRSSVSWWSAPSVPDDWSFLKSESIDP